MAMEDKANMDDVMRLAAVLSEAYLKKVSKGLLRPLKNLVDQAIKMHFIKDI